MIYKSTLWDHLGRSLSMHIKDNNLADWTIFNMWPINESEMLIVWQRSEPRKRVVFVPPTLEEVKTYIEENRFKVIAEDFIRHYAERDWENVNGKKVKNWKQTLRDVWARGLKEPPKPKEDYTKPKY